MEKKVGKEKTTILIVDDTHENLQVLGNLLQNKKYKIAFADNGPKALAIAEKLVPDLILLDVMMPDMDGFEVCRRLKKTTAIQDIPVIFLTAKTDTESVITGFEIGAVDYVAKPFNKKELLARVRTHVDLQNSKRILERKNHELRKALEEIKTLRGIIPICAKCKKIRDDEGYWERIERYIESHSEAMFSHGLCPDCMEVLYGDEEWFSP